YWDLGWLKSNLFSLQVFSLYITRLGFDAARRDRRVFRDWDYRHNSGADPFLSGRAAAMAMAGVLCILRRQGPDVAGAHLAPRCSCRGTDRGLGHPRRNSIEARRLRFPPILAPDVSARLQLLYTVDLRTQRHRRDLHLAGGACADRHEEAD